MDSFASFMRRVVALEDGQRSARKMLQMFQDNLESVRRAPVHEASPVVKDIFSKHPSSRLARYVEAGCRHLRKDKQSIAELNAAMGGLEGHVEQVRGALDELEEILDSALLAVSDEQLPILTFHEDEQRQLGKESMDCVTMMALILSMLASDYEMQRRIVKDVGLETQSEILQAYCTMWDLRPFFDDKVLEVALRLIK